MDKRGVSPNPIWNRSALKVGLCAISLAAAALFFVGGPDYYSPRAFRMAWDLGHLPAFFIWTAAVLAISRRFATTPIASQLLIAAAVVVPVGLGIEWFQVFVGRDFELRDVANDFLGSAAAIVFLSPGRRRMRKATLRAVQSAIAIFFVLQVEPLVRVIIDDVIARAQFPVLSDFETPFERTRWASQTPITVDDRIARHGKASLRVPLTTDKYSGASLRHFPSDWGGYKALHISIYNQSKDHFAITVSIHDKQHVQTGRAYQDRFTGRFILDAGWNDIDIPLDRVRTAPADRTIDLRRILDLSILAISLPTPHVIFVDDIRLKK